MTTVERRRLALIALAAVVVDVLTKLAAVRWLTGPVELPGLTLRITHNSGVPGHNGTDEVRNLS